MKGCWTEQIFQCFAPGKIYASSGSFAYSLSKKKPQNNHYTLQKNNPLAILCFILNTCFTRFLGCKRPLNFSKDNDCFAFYRWMLNAKLTNMPKSVRAPDPPKAHSICLSIFIRLHRSPTLNLQILTFVLIIQEKWHKGNCLWIVCEVLLSLDHNFQALSSFKEGVLNTPYMSQSHKSERDKVRFFLTIAKVSLLLPN